MALYLRTHLQFNVISNLRFLCTAQVAKNVPDLIKCPNYIELCDNWSVDYVELANKLINSMTVHDNFVNDEEESNILTEIEPYLKRMHYEKDHWDDAIHNYRETERLKWKSINATTINRVRELAFPKGVAQLKHVHILDLKREGYIKPHIDAVRFCGNTIAGISLLTDCVMRLVNDKNKTLWANVLLKRKSLYVMKDDARYDYTHEVLPNELSVFKGRCVDKDRRISVICRNEPVSDDITA